MEPRPHHGGMSDQPPSTRATSDNRFGRMFERFALPEMVLKLSTCEALGNQMTAQVEEARADSTMPAGYTYFGQFVDHDLSMDTLQGEKAEDGVLNPTPIEDLMQARSPQLDLDSLYTERADLSQSLFDGPRFKIGTTSPTDFGSNVADVNRALNYDLPRLPSSDPSRPAGKALIGDPRNDENLAVAQIHLMWLKFHNAVVDTLEAADPTRSPEVLFAMAKDLVTKHYQHIILHDFLPRFVDPDIYNSVIIDQNRKFLTHNAGEVTFMPLEFSVAGYRHGHSQVRQIYDWNVVFLDPGFDLLFKFSEVSGGADAMFNNPTLPTNWIADYRRLFEIDGSVPNFAKALDPYIAQELAALPELEDQVEEGRLPFANLAALNIRRGSLRGLPAAQDISKSINTVRTLTETDMRSVLDDDFAQMMGQAGLFERTPLWLYLLIEAAFEQQGNALGKLGSIIVAETFLTMILTSKTSILRSGAEWDPNQAVGPLGLDNPLTTIAEILVWMDALEPIIDPLRDPRL